ncbi:uncharacterized protein LOC130800538 isoform X2 [Amaranthus tricolor]|uniref:uncharacterized protein LOC130800538 isoform X2 n=1 Tax=Amaranthus tricolor TaxID=29722 RepID=UPI002585DB77|nr:uncharacterized protein LOC130800538 isoform X2 [Amaranthus tricolor]
MELKKKSNWPPPAWKETIKVNNGRRYKVVKADCPEWLPTSWLIERRIRKSGTKMGMEYKCFIDPSTEAKFFSKPEVLRYLKSKQRSAGSSRRKNKGFIDQPRVLKSNLEREVPKVMKARVRKSTPSRKVKFVLEKTSDEELPSGWIKETKIKMRGDKVLRRDSYFLDPVSRLVFQSKLEALRYVGTGEISRYAYRRRNQISVVKDFADGHISMLIGPPSVLKSNLEPEVSQVMKTRVLRSTPSRKVVMERTSEEELPSGWIKETKIKMLGDKVLRRDSYFLDPTSRLVFQSKLEALHYVRTGEISRYARRRRNQISVRTNFAAGNSSTSFCNLEEALDRKSTIQLFAIEGCSGPSIQVLPEAGVIEEAGSRKRKSSSRVGKRPSAGVSTRNRNTVSSRSTGNSKELVVVRQLLEKDSTTREAADVTKCTPVEVQDTDVKYAFPRKGEPFSSPSTGVLLLESPGAVSIQDGNGGKTQSSIKTKNTKLSYVPSRSSKRLAGVDPEVVFHRIPIEYALRSTSPSNSVLPSDSSVAVAIQDGNSGKAQSSKMKTKNVKLPYVPSRSSKRLAGVDAEVVFHRIPIEYALRSTSPSSGVLPLDSPVPVAIQDGNSGKAQISKKETNNVKLPYVPSRSSKRLAGVDAEVVFHRIPIERALRSTSSCGVVPLESHGNSGKAQISKKKTKNVKLSYVPSRSSKRLAGVDAEVVFHRIPIEHALQSTTRKMSRTKPVSCLGSAPNELHQMHQDVDRKNLKEDVLHATSRKSCTVESVLKKCHERHQALDTQNELTSQEVIHHPVDLKTDLLAAQGEQSLKKFDGTFQEKMHRTDIMLATREEQPSNRIDDLTFLDKQRHTLDINLLPTIGESLNKIDDVPYQEEKQFTLDLNTITVHATRGEPWNNIDKSTKKPILVDLNDLQLETPPGFSENMKQSSELSTDTLLRNKAKNVLKGQTMPEDRSQEQLTSIDKQTEQPQFESFFSASLWSDPCLDFAFKTLTGVIPIDDNMAFKDYIQQQIRTSEPSPRNDKTKVVTQSTEGCKFPKS